MRIILGQARERTAHEVEHVVHQIQAGKAFAPAVMALHQRLLHAVLRSCWPFHLLVHENLRPPATTHCRRQNHVAQTERESPANQEKHMSHRVARWVVTAAVTLVASLSGTGTARAGYGYTWTAGHAQHYLVTYYANIDVASCAGRGKATKKKGRANQWSRFGCVVVYSNGHTGIVGLAPTSANHAGVVFL